MKRAVNRDELIELVRRIASADGTEEELEQMMATLEQSVTHPDVLDLIFYPPRTMAVEEIVDIIMAYEPPRLA